MTETEAEELFKVQVTWDRGGNIDGLGPSNEYIVKRIEMPTFYANLCSKGSSFHMFTTHMGIKIVISKARIRDISIEKKTCADSAKGED